MWNRIRGFLGRFLPVPARTFHLGMQEIAIRMQEMANRMQEMADKNARDLRKTKEVLIALQKEIDRLVDTNRRIDDTNRRIYDTNRKIYATSEKTNAATERISGTANEVLWAEIFNSTSFHECDWFNDKTLSPGRWAAGYQFLYVLYRVLNEIRPSNILELGLGQSTRMITQYVKKQPEVVHQVVEHDEEWISHFALSFSLEEQSKVVKLPLETESFMDDDVPVYGGFADAFAEQKFDLISIDGPYGFLSKVYARIDVLKLMPGCLADSFVIMVDDYNRQNAKNTVELMKQKLDEHGISYKTGLYHGIKSLCVIASEDLGFVCSM